MRHPVLGLHHVTATADQAQADLDFYLGVLGLRLVKKTVNFDNHSVYHFYYGTEIGAPGTIWTTFPYAGMGVPLGLKGAGQIRTTTFAVPVGSLGFWTDRLAARGLDVAVPAARFGRGSIECLDPSGLVIELRESDDPRAPWAGGHVEPAQAIRGLDSVSLIVRSADATVRLLSESLNFSVAHESPDRVRLTVGGDASGRALEVVSDPHAAPARNGLGTVHHVALAIGTADEQLTAREDLLAAGFRVTPVMDRQYFQSIYFREPGGILFEIATMKPGFLVDEARDHLGHALKLPPWEEPHRRIIEATLPPVTYE